MRRSCQEHQRKTELRKRQPRKAEPDKADLKQTAPQNVAPENMAPEDTAPESTAVENAAWEKTQPRERDSRHLRPIKEVFWPTESCLVVAKLITAWDIASLTVLA